MNNAVINQAIRLPFPPLTAVLIDSQTTSVSMFIDHPPIFPDDYVHHPKIVFRAFFIPLGSSAE
jgi:hypothetical protein